MHIRQLCLIGMSQKAYQSESRTHLAIESQKSKIRVTATKYLILALGIVYMTNLWKVVFTNFLKSVQCIFISILFPMNILFPINAPMTNLILLLRPHSQSLPRIISMNSVWLVISIAKLKTNIVPMAKILPIYFYSQY